MGIIKVHNDLIIYKTDLEFPPAAVTAALKGRIAVPAFPRNNITPSLDSLPAGNNPQQPSTILLVWLFYPLPHVVQGFLMHQTSNEHPHYSTSCLQQLFPE